MTAPVFRRAAGDPPMIVGHRGVRGGAPENTMVAFELAAQQGAGGVELDVRLCKSGEVVVCHDPTLERVSGGRDRRAVAAMTPSELAQANVGDGQPVPLLHEVLAWAHVRGLVVNVEMKRDVPSRRELVRQTARALAASRSRDIIVSSFDPLMLAYFRALSPSLSIGYLFARDQSARGASWGAALLRAGAIHPERTCVDAERCRAWRARGHAINVWTVNDPGEAARLAALGVDAIITDVPDAMSRVIR